jgi:hypothetical protein
MPIGRPPSREIKLDGRKLLIDWLTLGSLYRVQKNLVREGTFNVSTKRPYTVVGILLSVWKWCIYHENESYELVKKYRIAEGEYTTKEEWHEEVMAHAAQSMRSSDYKKFLTGEYVSKE